MSDWCRGLSTATLLCALLAQIFISPQADAYAVNLELGLSAEERAFLDAHTELRVAVPSNVPGIVSTLANGELDGVLIDILALIDQQLELDLIPVPLPNEAFTYGISQDKFPLSLSFSPVINERRFISRSDTLLEINYVIVSNNSIEDVRAVSEFASHKIGLTRGDGILPLFRKQFPEGIYTEFESSQSGLDALATGTIDAYLTNDVEARYWLSKKFARQHWSINSLSQFYQTLDLKVVGDNPVLAKIIEKVEGAISGNSKAPTLLKWGVADSTLQKLHISPREQTWLEARTTMKVGVNRSWAPFDYIDDKGEHKGLASEYIDLISRTLGLQVEVVVRSDWKSLLEELRLGNIDVVAAITPTPSRARSFLLSEPYYHESVTVFTRHSNEGSPRFHVFESKSLAIMNDSWIKELIEQHFPNISVTSVSSIERGLNLLSDGTTDVFIGDRESAMQAPSIAGVDNVEVTATQPERIELSIAVNKQLPELKTLIDKIVTAVDRSNRRYIEQTWLDRTNQKVSINEPAKQQRLRYTLIVLAVLVGLVAFSIWLLKGQKWRSFLLLLGNRKLSILAPAFVGIYLCAILFMAWFAMERMNQDMRARYGISLTSVNKMVVGAIEDWARDVKHDVTTLANETDTLVLVEEYHGQKNMSRKELIESNNHYFAFLNRYLTYSNADSVFLIDAEGSGIIAAANSGYAYALRIQQEHPELLARVMAGDTLVVPPLKALIEEDMLTKRYIHARLATFVMAPIKNSDGEVLAAAVLGYRPSVFDEITDNSRYGNASESYIFDEYGRIMSTPEFFDQSALVTQVNEKNSRLIYPCVCDPGGNLTGGFSPTLKPDEWPLTMMAEKAVAGINGLNLVGYRDYRGVSVLGAWQWSSELGVGVVTEIDTDTALNSYIQMRAKIYIALLGVTLMTLGFAALSNWLSKRSRVKLETLVKERTENLHVIVEALEQSPISVLIADVSNVVYYVNAKFLEMTGYSADAVIGRKTSELDEGLSLSTDQHRHIFDESVSGRIWNGEVQLKSQDGTEYWVSKVVAPVHSSSSVVTHLITLFEDITQRRALEQSRQEVESALRQSEGRYAAVLQGVNDGIWDWNLESKEFYLSARNQEIIGAPAMDVVQGSEVNEEGNPWCPLWETWVHPDNLEEVVDIHARCATGELEHFQLEYRLLHTKGHYVWIAVRGAGIRDNSGKVVRIAGTQTDISNRKEMETLLSAEKDQLNEILSTSPVGVSLTVDGVIELANPTLLQLLGLDLGDDIKDSYADPKLYQRLQSILRKNDEVRDVETALVDVEGTERHCLVSLYPMDFQGRPGVLQWIVDISALKEIQVELLIARDEAEAATQAKSDFLANMSHEVRTPMNAIMGMSHLALQTSLNEKQRNYIEKVHRSAANLLGIINDILDFSKIEAGKLELESIDFDLRDVLDNLATITTLSTESKGLELLFNFGEGVSFELVGDPLRLGQTLLNLTTNAIKFTEAGTISISISLLEEKPNGCLLQFSVTDTGIGMSEEQQQKLFQSFSQVDSSITRRFGGTGLGLVISKTITELMGGRIWVESEPLKGSTFHFTGVFGRQKLGQKDRRVGWEARSIKMLIVDDSAIALDATLALFRSEHMDPDSAISGEQAIDLIQSAAAIGEPYQLIVTDWKMSGLNGVELVKKIIADERVGTLPQIYFVTAHGKENIIDYIEDLPVAGTLSKPIMPTDIRMLLQAVSNELDKNLGSKGEAAYNENEENETEPELDIGGVDILLVEDNELNQEFIAELLEMHGGKVTIADNGAVAVEILASKIFDVVLMDCQMPIMDGFQATKLLRQNTRYDNLPIVALTSNVMASDITKVLDAGMDDHVGKPVNIDELLSTLIKWKAKGRNSK